MKTKPKIIKAGEPFILGDTTYIYEIRDSKLILSKYKDSVKKVSSADFEKLWKLHSKGNKTTAKERFSKVGHKLPIQTWIAKLTEYVASNEFVFLKGLDVYLNPAKEHWNDPIVYKDGVKPLTESKKDLIM